MSKALFSTIVFVAAFVMPVACQSMSFLTLPFDARTAGMGNAGYVLASPFAAHSNTAAIMAVDVPTMAVATSYLKWQPETMNSYLVHAGGYKIVGNVGLAAGFGTQRLPEIELTDGHGNPQGDFTPTEYTLELGVGYKISAPLTAGLALRYIHSDMGGTRKASALAADISMLYNRGRLSAGLGLTNVGSMVNYGYADYSLPTRLRAGVAFNALNDEKHRLIGVADVAYQLTPAYNGLISGVGIEYGYKGFLSLRGGTHFESKKVGPSYTSVGLGVHLRKLSVDVAHLFSLRTDFNPQAFVLSLRWIN